jgi:hypothetical protein
MYRSFGLIITCASLVGCASPSEEVTAQSEDSLTLNTCTARNIGSGTCQFWRYILTMSAPEGPRREALVHAFQWVEEGVWYSQSRYHQNDSGSYRQDCSGLVSLAWQTGTSYITSNMAPYNESFSTMLPEYDMLEPGDALNRYPVPHAQQHVVLFAGWEDDSHENFFVLQEAGTGQQAKLTRVTRDYLNGFEPIRLNGM